MRISCDKIYKKILSDQPKRHVFLQASTNRKAVCNNQINNFVVENTCDKIVRRGPWVRQQKTLILRRRD
jgi:hypothetical protein